MTRFRYSINALLLAVTNILLLVDTLSALGPGQPSTVVARGGLNFCTLFFSLFCGLIGESAPRTLRLVAVFYTWGQISLFLGGFEIPDLLRISLAAVGVAFVAWVWQSGRVSPRLGP